ncbi:MAG: CxxxxCH/CxxCH domain-containing protein, partial [Prochlorococcaceae cyanobacterium]
MRAQPPSLRAAAARGLDATGSSRPVNGARNVNTSDDAGTVWNGITCSNTYCHSDGTETPGFTAVPAWASGNLANDCKQCHGREVGSIAGAPWYANNPASNDTRNSHAKHVGAATDCVHCHAGTVTASGSLLGGG